MNMIDKDWCRKSSIDDPVNQICGQKKSQIYLNGATYKILDCLANGSILADIADQP
jgi:hypothetical protein